LRKGVKTMLKKLKDLKTINLQKIFNLQKVEKPMIYGAVAAVFVVANILLSSVSLRLDLSNGQAYTLSSSTKKIVKDLDDVVNVKFFVSSDLPTRLLPLKNEVTDLLNEYRKAGGKITVKVLDPKKDENVLNEARELGVPELQFSQLEKDKYAVSTAYFGMVLSYGDKKEVLPQVTNLESLEYDLTASIYKLTRKELVKIGILGQTDVFNPQEDAILSLKNVLSQQFEYDFIDLEGEVKEIDPSHKAILVFDNNQKEYTQEEVAAIQNYLDNQGKAIFFVDGVWVKDDLVTDAAKNNLSSIWESFGIKVGNNLVLSTTAELVNFGNQMVSFFTPYPFWLKTNNFNDKASFFSNVRQLTFPWTSSLTVAKKNGVEINELIKTTEKSWIQKDSFNLDPQTIPQPASNELKTHLLSAQAKNNQGGEIIIIPSSRFIVERFLSRTSGNLEFILNALNELASEGALSGIRQRAVNYYPLPDMSESQKDIFKYLNILLLPSVFGLYGAFRLIKRK
jgi:ABC-type uncharacterized transport system involved in gliding motility auxiliary subunit